MHARLLPLLLILAVNNFAFAVDLSLPPIFSNHAVLQKTSEVPIWGKAAPGVPVTVILGEVTGTTKADAQGAWLLNLDLSKSGPGPFTLAVSAGEEKLEFQDVLVGQVWLASGQSNMAWTLAQTIRGKEDVASSANPNIRGFRVESKSLSEVSKDLTGSWVIAGPETSGQFSAVAYYFAKTLQKELGVPVGIIRAAWGGSTAEAWISSATIASVPVLAEAANQNLERQKAFPAESSAYPALFAKWMEKHALQDRREMSLEEVLALKPDELTAIELPVEKVETQSPGAVWFLRHITLPEQSEGKAKTLPLLNIHGMEEVFLNGKKLERPNTRSSLGLFHTRIDYPVPAGVLTKGENQLAIRIFNPVSTPHLQMNARPPLFEGISLAGRWKTFREFSLPAPDKTVLAEKPAEPIPPNESNKTASALYNGMIYPLAPYAIAGCIWYQGESNSSRASEYHKTFSLLIQDWRKLWNRENLPFYWAQLTSYREKSAQPDAKSTWAKLREAQDKTLSLPFTGQAVTLDVGEVHDIHPREKEPVGNRLAAIALAKNYNLERPFRGPVFESMKIDGSKCILHFSDTAGGLFAAPLPERHPLSTIPPEYAPLTRNSPDSELEGFSICGSDNQWKWANAKIEGDTVVVSSPEVKEPVAVRYAWADNPTANLWGKNGFPAGPFRTDSQDSSSKSD